MRDKRVTKEDKVKGREDRTVAWLVTTPENPEHILYQQFEESVMIEALSSNEEE